MTRLWLGIVLGVACAACDKGGGTSGQATVQGSDSSGATTAGAYSSKLSQQEDTLAPPLAKGCPAGKAPINQKELDACISTLQFDSTEENGDEQRLLVLDVKGAPACLEDPKHTCSYGPLAKIEPVRNAHKYSPEDMRQGRIIARLFVRDKEKGYPKLGLQPGHMTYWWVQYSSGEDTGRGYYITDLTKGDRLLQVARPVKVERYPPGTLKQALASWIWTIEDETTQGHCGTATCK
jgi:hypothetical protein